MIAGDLRDFGDILTKLESRGLDKSLPTLFLSECVLIYLDTEVGDSIVCKASSFPLASFVTYEQIMPDDPFGKTMLSNLKVARRDLRDSFVDFRFYPSIHTLLFKPRRIDTKAEDGWAQDLSIFLLIGRILSRQKKRKGSQSWNYSTR